MKLLSFARRAGTIELMSSCEPLIDLSRGLGSLSIPRPVAGLVERILAFDLLNNCHAEIAKRCAKGEDFFHAGLQAAGVVPEIPEGDVLRVPARGPLIVVANHPFGAREAFVLGSFLLLVRRDIRFLANHLLMRMPEIRPWMIPVDPFDGPGSASRNASSMKEALRWLRQGGCLVVFPAGAVSHWSNRELTVTDPEWSTHAASLARRTGSAVLPVYFEGRNSCFFQIAGMIHPVLRTLLLPGEVFGASGKITRAYCGRALPPERIAEFDSDASLTEFLRFRVYVEQKRSGLWREDTLLQTRMAPEPLIPAISSVKLREEVEGLPASCLLFHQAGFSVLVASACRIPFCLSEISRLREKTFREAGEGTGGSCDTDGFDQDYLHLFLWNEVTQQIAGAYRLALVDQILEKRGRKGLYTSTLFNYKPGFLRHLGPSIELGRSFICSEYQKKVHPLFLLWKGIGTFVCRHPRYRTLLGPVSISRDYHALSRNLMVQFFQENPGDALARLVTAESPPRQRHSPGLKAGRIREFAWKVEDVSALVTEIEDGSRGIPVLLRHYWKMNAKILCFNEDKSFSDVWDGLIMVDLCQSDPALLKKFMGEEGLRCFQAFHTQGSAELQGIDVG